MRYLIDAGSNSIKIFSLDQNKSIIELEKKSYTLSQKYDKENILPLSEQDEMAIIDIFKYYISKYGLTRSNTKIFATGHFRYMSNIQEFIEIFGCFTKGLFFNVISQDLETFFQDVKFLPYSYNSNKMIVITIGGGSIQISFYNNGMIEHEPVNLNWGTKTILKHCSSTDTTVLLETVENYLKETLPETHIEKYPIAILPGGEITYMKRANYPIKANSLLNDKEHPISIPFSDYEKYNKKIFSEMTLEELRALMPDDPNWMDGSIPYCAIAQRICKLYGVENIIPSDCNIMHGAAQQEARTAVVCGSYKKYWNRIYELILDLQRRGIKVLSPTGSRIVQNRNGFVLFETDNLDSRCNFEVELPHLRAINECDMVVVCNYDNYIGSSTASEIGWAFCQGKKTVYIENNSILEDRDWPGEIGLL